VSDDDNTPRITDGECKHYSGSFELVPPNDMFGQALLQRVQRMERHADEQTLHVASLLASRKAWRWIAGIAGPVLFSALVTVFLYSAERDTQAAQRIEASAERIGTMNARIEALQQLTNILLGEISTLRMEIHKITGYNPHPSLSISQAP